MPNPATRYLSSGFGAADPVGTGQNTGSVSQGIYGENYALTPDYPVYDPTTGKMHHYKTGQPYNGIYNGQQYTNGVLSGQAVPYSTTGQAINPNNPTQRYKPVTIPKGSPAAGPASDLLDSFNRGTAEGLKDFNTYLGQARGEVGNAVTASKAAADIEPTAATLTGAQGRYAGSLDAANARYQAQLAANAAAEQGVVSQADANLPLYDAAANRAEAIAQDAAQRTVNRYAMGKNAGGANFGLGTDVARMALEKSYEASSPYEMAKVQRRYANLSEFGLPVARDLGQQGITYAGSFLPQISQAAFTSAQGTAMAIQGLKEAAANRDWQTVQQIMQLPGAAAAIRNQIYSGDLALLSAFNALYSQTNYQGLQDVLGAQVNQPVGYNMATGGYPTRAVQRYPVAMAPGVAPAAAPANRYAPGDVSYAVNTTGTLGGLNDYTEPYRNFPAPPLRDTVLPGNDIPAWQAA